MLENDGAEVVTLEEVTFVADRGFKLAKSDCKPPARLDPGAPLELARARGDQRLPMLQPAAERM
jgi:hypothetical protein